MHHHQIIFSLALRMRQHRILPGLLFSVDSSSIRSTQGVFPRYLQRAFFHRLCVFSTCYCVVFFTQQIVGAVRAIYIVFGSDSSKSTKFGINVAKTILFRFERPPGPSYWRNPIYPPPGLEVNCI